MCRWRKWGGAVTCASALFSGVACDTTDPSHATGLNIGGATGLNMGGATGLNAEDRAKR